MVVFALGCVLSSFVSTRVLARGCKSLCMLLGIQRQSHVGSPGFPHTYHQGLIAGNGCKGHRPAQKLPHDEAKGVHITRQVGILAVQQLRSQPAVCGGEGGVGIEGWGGNFYRRGWGREHVPDGS